MLVTLFLQIFSKIHKKSQKNCNAMVLFWTLSYENRPNDHTPAVFVAKRPYFAKGEEKRECGKK